MIVDIRRKIKFGTLCSRLVSTKPSTLNRGQSWPQSWQCDLPMSSPCCRLNDSHSETPRCMPSRHRFVAADSRRHPFIEIDFLFHGFLQLIVRILSRSRKMRSYPWIWFSLEARARKSMHCQRRMFCINKWMNKCCFGLVGSAFFRQRN